MTTDQTPKASMKRVVIVDDVNEFQVLAEMMLQYLGIKQVTSYTSAVNALPKLVESPPDLLLLDVMMAEMDGLTLLQKLRAHPHTAQLRVIICTAAINQFIDQEEWLRSDPLVRILAKPFSVEDLQETMADLLQG